MQALEGKTIPGARRTWHEVRRSYLLRIKPFEASGSMATLAKSSKYYIKLPSNSKTINI